jgi:hypothetical protein
VKFLRTDEIEGNSMSTIHPPANGISYNREEQAANTWSGPKRLELSDEERNKQLADIRARSPQNPESYSAKAARARAEQTARQQAHNDKLREALAGAERAKVRPLTFAERQLVAAANTFVEVL